MSSSIESSSIESSSIESCENLARLDQEMVELEQRPKDAQLLASILRTIHTIKGTWLSRFRPA
jgi:two-component system chemotaxis sensor kinase CheA